LNIILFSQEELNQALPKDDPRHRHILKVLRRGEGEDFDAGLINGPRGKAWWTHSDEAGLHLAFRWASPPAPLPAVHLILPFARPQTMRKVLQEATASGLERFLFFCGEKAEASYRDSSLWSSGEYHRHLRQGTEQAFCTRIPEILLLDTLEEALEHIPNNATRLCLDNYEASHRFDSHLNPLPAPIYLAIGGERGWSANERDTFRANGFTLVHLGERVLRTETAVISALALAHAALASS